MLLNEILRCLRSRAEGCCQSISFALRMVPMGPLPIADRTLVLANGAPPGDLLGRRLQQRPDRSRAAFSPATHERVVLNGTRLSGSGDNQGEKVGKVPDGRRRTDQLARLLPEVSNVGDIGFGRGHARSVANPIDARQGTNQWLHRRYGCAIGFSTVRPSA